VKRRTASSGLWRVMMVSPMVAASSRNRRNRAAPLWVAAAEGTIVMPRPHSTIAICEVTERAQCAGIGLNPAARHRAAIASW
jgi:hypothetical protein